MTEQTEDEKELARLEAIFEHNGGRVIDLADRIDELRERVKGDYYS